MLRLALLSFLAGRVRLWGGGELAVSKELGVASGQAVPWARGRTLNLVFRDALGKGDSDHLSRNTRMAAGPGLLLSTISSLWL